MWNLDLCMWPLAYNYKYTERTGMWTFLQKYTDHYEWFFFSLQVHRLLRWKVIIKACWHHLLAVILSKKHCWFWLNRPNFGHFGRMFAIEKSSVFPKHNAEVDHHVLMASIPGLWKSASMVMRFKSLISVRLQHSFALKSHVQTLNVVWMGLKSVLSL